MGVVGITGMTCCSGRPEPPIYQGTQRPTKQISLAEVGCGGPCVEQRNFRFRRQDKNTTDKGSRYVIGLEEAVHEFLAHAGHSIGESHHTTNDEALLDSAGEFVDGFLLGLNEQLPGLKASADVHWDTESATLVVRFVGAPLMGEIATRSRIGYFVRLGKEVRITLRLPSATTNSIISADAVSATTPLRLHFSGISFEPFPEVEPLRKRIQEVLGSNFNQCTAFEWWDANKDEVSSLQDSKLRWALESILSMRSAQAVMPQNGKERLLWGFLHCRPLELVSFEFRESGTEGIRVNGTCKDPVSPEDKRVQAAYDEVAVSVSQKDLSLGEYFMPSSVNWLALFHAETLRQSGLQVTGANPKLVTKLFSAAKEWGPGEDGWQANDHTWNCVDQKDVLGRFTLKQGRIVWRESNRAGWFH